jgi:hypothetical protein
MNTYRVEIEKDYHDDQIHWLKVSHNGGAAWSLIEIRSSLEAEQIVNALQSTFVESEEAREAAQQSVEPTAPRIKAGDNFSYMLSQQIKKD